MKINSEYLYQYINNLATNEKVKFNVYFNDQYVTQIYWNGESFEWDTGTFTSEAFFNPFYDFEPIENKMIERLSWGEKESMAGQLSQIQQIDVIARRTEKLKRSVNKILDYLESKGE